MTKALYRETLRSIRRTKARFISIIAIVALGISFFAGIKAAYPDMHQTTVDYYQRNNLMDIWGVSTIGFSDNDIDAIKQIAEVKEAAGSKFVDSSVKADGKDVTGMDGSTSICRVYGFNRIKAKQFTENGVNDPGYINRLTLVEGRYPENESECLIDHSRLSTPESFKIGAEIEVTGIEQDLSKQLANTKFKVVGIIETPRYVSIERGQTTVGDGSLDCFIYIPDEAFATPFYTELFVTLNGTEDYDIYGEDYFNYVSSCIDKIDAIAPDCLENTAPLVLDYYGDELKKAKEEYEKAKKEAETKLGDAFKELEDNKNKIAAAEQQLSQARVDAEAKFNEKYQELLSGESQYSEGIKEYNSKLSEYNNGKKKLEDGKKQLKQIQKALSDEQKQLDTLKKGYDKLQVKVDSYNAEIKNIQNEINSKTTEIENANSRIEAINNKIEELNNDTEQVTQEDGTVIDVPVDHTEEINTLTAEKNELNGKLPALQSEKSNLEAQLNNKKTELSNYKKDSGYNDMATAIAKCNILIKGYEVAIDDANSQIKDGEKELAAGKKELDKAKKELEKAGLEIEGGWDAYNSAYAAANKELSVNSDDLEEAKRKLDSASKEYDENKESAYEKLDNAEYSIKENEKIVNAAVHDKNWNIFDRNSIVGYEGYGQTAENMKAFAKIFPLFFFVVAGLVCLTTMTRMVDEERTQLGTLKALGYTNRKIRSKYLLYALLASLIGSILGLSVGLVVYPKAIFAAYGLMYELPSLVVLFPWQYIVSGTGCAVGSTLLVTFIACWREMRICPAQLMRPKAPKAGKRVLLEHIPFIWKHLSFTSKVTVRNIFRNKKRFFMTLIGIAGCTALLLTGFGLSDSINAIITAQYGKNGINHTDAQIVFKNSQKTVDGSEIYSMLSQNDSIKEVMMFYNKIVDGSKAEGASDVTDPADALEVNLVVPHDKNMLSDFISLQNRETGEQYKLTDNGGKNDCGVLISEKFAKECSIHKGDYVKLKINSAVVSLYVSGIVENYTYHYVYMSPERYSALADGETPAYNYAYALYNDAIKQMPDGPEKDSVRAQISEELMRYNDINAVIDIESVSETFGTMFKSLDSVIMVFIISAAALAFIVLYNLTNININERKREIATLKVLGFHNRESSNYIGRENLTITIIGIILGVIGGIYLHKFVVEVAEVNVVMFGRTIDWTSYIWSVALTFVFSLLVSFVMHFRIKRIHMIESLKSIE